MVFWAIREFIKIIQEKKLIDKRILKEITIFKNETNLGNNFQTKVVFLSKENH
jgi:hypothetical protein